MATVSAAILAVGSIFTAFIGFSTWRHVQETSRPYFSLIESPKITELDDQSLSIHLVNAGDHPAETLKSKITMTLAETGKDIYEYDNQLLSTTPKNSETHLLIDLSEWPDGGETPFAHEFYMTLWLSYYDPLLQKTFEQDFHLKWNGLVDGHYEEMTYMTQKEFQDLLDAAKRNNNR